MTAAPTTSKPKSASPMTAPSTYTRDSPSRASKWRCPTWASAAANATANHDEQVLQLSDLHLAGNVSAQYSGALVMASELFLHETSSDDLNVCQ